MWYIDSLKVFFQTPPTSNVNGKISYRKKSEPDLPSSYTTVKQSTAIKPDGTVPGLIIELAEDVDYMVRVEIPGCSVFTKEFKAPVNGTTVPPTTAAPTIPPTNPPTTTAPTTAAPTTAAPTTVATTPAPTTAAPTTIATTAAPTTPPTTVCQRPDGVLSRYLAESSNDGTTARDFWNVSAAAACSAWNEFKKGSNGSINMRPVEYEAFEVGQKVYLNHDQNHCTTTSGFFWYYPNANLGVSLGYFYTAESIQIVTVTNGVITAIDTCNFVPDTTVAPTTVAPTTAAPTTAEGKVWVADTTMCEKDSSVFEETQEITGVSSPFLLHYDNEKASFYGVDMDNPAGNFFKFNPETIATKDDISYIPNSSHGRFYSRAVDERNRRLFGVGYNQLGGQTGLVVLNIADDTVQVIPYGTNNENSRNNVTIVGETIFLYDDFSNHMVLLNRDTLAQTADIDLGTVPNSLSYFNQAFNMFAIGGNLWVAAAQRGDGRIGVYSTDLTTLVAEILIPGIQAISGWGFGLYWQGQHYDAQKDKLYLNDLGSNQLVVIDGTSRSIVETITFDNRVGKLHAAVGFSTDPLTGTMFLGYRGINSSSDGSPDRRVYRINRDTYEIEMVYPDDAFDTLVLQGGSSSLWATYSGLPVWLGGDWATDGKISKYSFNTGGGNTGRRLTLTLKEVGANSNTPTGEKKSNVQGEPDYIPPVTDATCPISYNFTCPQMLATVQSSTDVARFEFSLPKSVVDNPAISKISVRLMKDGLVQDEVVFTLPNGTPNYFAGGLIAQEDGAYTVDVAYLNSSDVVQTNCFNLASLTFSMPAPTTEPSNTTIPA